MKLHQVEPSFILVPYYLLPFDEALPPTAIIKAQNQKVKVDRTTRCPDPNGANGSPIRVRMKKIELVNVGLISDDFTRLMKAQFRLSLMDGIRPNMAVF